MPQGDFFKFTNIETPRAYLDFVFNKKLLRLEDGKVYQDQFDENLGAWMSDHLNSLEIPETVTEVDSKTGQFVTKVVGVRPRFSCVPVRPGEKKSLKDAVGK